MQRLSPSNTILSPSNTINAIRERTCAALCVYGICAILAMGCTAGPELELDLPAGSIGSEVIAPNNLLFNSLGANGINVNGINVNGINFNGVSLNGINVNGVSVNGINVNGINVNGLGLSGVVLDGLALTEVRVSGLALNPVTAGNVELLLGYLAECALLSGQCITVHALDGTPLTLCGAEGIDYGWGSGLPDLARAGAMGTCVLDRATAAGQSASFTPVNIQAFKRVLQYMVECALDEGESVTIYDENNAPVNYYGSLGLAKHWASQPLSATGQRKVSACLAARSNALQQPVQISLRGAGLHTQSTEIDLYPTHEGAFWADLFASQPYVNTCLVTGGGLSGRVCADGDECGFMRTGDCATVCQHQSSDGSYTGCAGSDEVVNTFLALGSQIRFGARHMCTTQMDGSLWCKGENSSGELGTGAVSGVEQAMMPVAALGQSVAESGGGEAFSCARKSNGTLWCWGKNNHGQLGDGTGQDRAVPAQITALGSDVASFGLSHRSGCAHTTDGSLWCWGKNNHGQLGDGTSQDRLSPVKVTDLGDQVAGVSTGSHSATTCSVLNDGSVWCWGKNNRGQLGDGTTASKNRPVQVATNEQGQPFGGVTEVCTGVAHTCARAADGKVWCWGDDRRGQLGDDQSAAQNPQSRPVRVKLSGKAAPSGLTCGKHHTCAVNEDGSLWCWGDNSSGALGDGTYTNRTRPVRVTSLGNEVMQATAASERSCSFMIDGSVFCWGRDDTGVLFPGTTTSTPVEVSLSAP